MSSTWQRGKTPSSNSKVGTANESIKRDAKATGARWMASLLLPLALAVLALTPREWSAKAGEWLLLLRENGVVLALSSLSAIVLLALALLVRAYQRERQLLTRVSKIVVMRPQLYDDRRAQMRMNSVLEELVHGDAAHPVKILAATSATVEKLISTYIATRRVFGPLTIHIAMIDPDAAAAREAAAHWSGEAGQQLHILLPRLQARISELHQPITLEWRLYDYLPALQGWLVDDTHLFLGWFDWVEVGGGVRELRGAERPLIYIHKDDEEAPYYFNLFRGWFDRAWNGPSPSNASSRPTPQDAAGV